MKITDKYYFSLWFNKQNDSRYPLYKVSYIDQRYLPFSVEINEIKTYRDAVKAIKNMSVRGAPLIGVTASFGFYVACIESQKVKDFKKFLTNAYSELLLTRPTAVNLKNNLSECYNAVIFIECEKKRIEKAFEKASEIWDRELDKSKKIADFGYEIIKKKYLSNNKKTVNILTHCNAGWLACIDYGTATAPIYSAAEKGIDVHVWVDETRPRNQGARLTCFELSNMGIKNTLVTDNAGGLLMQKGLVDMVIVGSDRTTLDGNVVNKIGTYLKALAAFDNKVPFYVALPVSSIDLVSAGNYDSIVIEERDQDEVRYVEGKLVDKNSFSLESVLITDEKTNCSNYGFDITPAQFITAYITDRGILTQKDLIDLKDIVYE